MIQPQWEETAKLVFSWVNKYARSCPAADPVELEGVGRLAWVEALQTWDPSKGAFTTHLVWTLRWKLTAHIRREIAYTKSVAGAREELAPQYDADGALVDIPAPTTWLSSLLDLLGPDARDAVRALLDGETLPVKGNRRTTKEIKGALAALRFA